MRYKIVCVAALMLGACSSEPESVSIDDSLMNVEEATLDAAITETKTEKSEAEDIESMSRNELLATAINSAGFLCARVTSAYPSGGLIKVECVEYRKGRKKVRYEIDPGSGMVYQS